MSPAERNLCRTGLSLCIMPGMGQGMASAQDETTKTTTKDLCRAEPSSTNEQTTTICVLYMALFSMFSLRHPLPLSPPAYTPPSSCSWLGQHKSCCWQLSPYQIKKRKQNETPSRHLCVWPDGCLVTPHPYREWAEVRERKGEKSS